MQKNREPLQYTASIDLEKTAFDSRRENRELDRQSFGFVEATELGVELGVVMIQLRNGRTLFQKPKNP